ncbi:MAG: aldehyde ferredoxin oxidoreductase family protein, partial [Spirochaetota bacterium]|nr:aldehyde ferredoxin oxidoreductase family protein [Spirochaetota bacterium]
AVAKSPLTGGWGDSNSGGYFAQALKQTGYDAIFFTGKSEKPVYLVLTDKEKELKDASHLWGKNIEDTEDLIIDELKDKKYRVACIGPGGENLSLISGIVNDKGRIAARSGLGAVMGSKKLKAVAVKGNQKIKIANKTKLNELNAQIKPIFALRPSKIENFINKALMPIFPFIIRMKVPLPPPAQKLVAQMFSDYGTCSFVAPSSETQDSPIKNWSGVAYKDFPMKTSSSKISDDNVIKYVKKKFSCTACPVGCGGIVEIKEGEKIKESHKPEYESIAAFGSVILNNDMESILKANDMCNNAGIDTISAGATLGFAIECYENGLITSEDTDGIELKWGDSDAVLKMLDKMIIRDGFGDTLADGTKVAAEKIGKGSDKFAMHVGGQEVAMHDPRLNPGFGTTYVSDPTPGRHTQAGLGYEQMGLGIMNEKLLGKYNLPKKQKKYDFHGKGKKGALVSAYGQIINCTGLCMFHFLIVPDYPLLDFINAATGWNISQDDLITTGMRIQTLRNLFNVREGIKPKDFALPERIAGKPALAKGPLKGVAIDIDTLKSDYYKEMGWDYETGMPFDEKLKELSLEKYAKGIKIK